MTNPPPSCFFVSGAQMPLFIIGMWTNGEAQTNQLSTQLDVYAYD